MRTRHQVDRALSRWGQWLCTETAYYPGSVAGRLNCAIATTPGGRVPRIPKIDHQSELISRAYVGLQKYDASASYVLFAHYTERGTAASKAANLKQSPKKYRALLRCAQAFIAGRV